MKFIYTGIRVRDLNRSLDFYTKIMDMKETSRGKMEEGGTFVELKSRGSDQQLELNYYPLETSSTRNTLKVQSLTT